LKAQNTTVTKPADSSDKNSFYNLVSKIGHYGSCGVGRGHVGAISEGLGYTLSYSLAYKSHLFSLTRYGATSLGENMGYNYKAGYTGLLAGESFRLEHLMASVSIGIAYSRTTVAYPISYPSPAFQNKYNRYGISYPIEIKIFFLTYNVFGVGVHITNNIVPVTKYSPLLFSFSLVWGQWNKPGQRNNYLHEK
jgi:hypothetical protein